MSARLSERDERRWIAGVISMAEQISDESLFALHSEVSRLATRARQRDPEYQERQRIGYALSRRA